jgi:hypothetical protein
MRLDQRAGFVGNPPIGVRVALATIWMSRASMSRTLSAAPAMSTTEGACRLWTRCLSADICRARVAAGLLSAPLHRLSGAPTVACLGRQGRAVVRSEGRCDADPDRRHRVTAGPGPCDRGCRSGPAPLLIAANDGRPDAQDNAHAAPPRAWSVTDQPRSRPHVTASGSAGAGRGISVLRPARARCRCRVLPGSG